MCIYVYNACFCAAWRLRNTCSMKRWRWWYMSRPLKSASCGTMTRPYLMAAGSCIVCYAPTRPGTRSPSPIFRFRRHCRIFLTIARCSSTCGITLRTLACRELSALDLSQAKRHQFLVKIALVQFERAPFQPIGFEALRDKEVTGFFAGEHHTQVDLFEARQGLRISNGSLQQRLAYTFSSQLLGHIHAPNVAFVAFFRFFLALEASNTYQRCSLEGTEGHVVGRGISLAESRRHARNASFEDFFIGCAERFGVVAQGAEPDVPKCLGICLSQYAYVHLCPPR